MSAPGDIGLPGHVVPVEGEALLSWVAALAAVLGMSPRVFCRDALGIDVQQDPAWWRRPTWPPAGGFHSPRLTTVRP